MEAGEADHAGRVTKTGRLKIESRRQNGSWLVEARGEIDLATIDALKAELQQRSTLPVVLDLNGVEFMDSSGINLLVATAGQVTVGRASPAVERLIRICGLETKLKFAHPVTAVPGMAASD